MILRAWAGRRALLLAASFACAVAPAHAQQALGVLATTCGALDANRSLAIDTIAAAPAGAVVVASIAGNGDVLADLSLADPSAGTYTAIGARRSHAATKLGVAQALVRFTTALPSGSRFTLRALAARPGTPACVSLAAFADVAVGTAALQSRAATGGNGTSPTLTGDRNGDGTPQLLLAAFAFAGDPSGFAPATPGAAVASACDATTQLCLGTLSVNDAGGGALALGATLGTAVAWSGVLASLDRETLLKNGFE